MKKANLARPHLNRVHAYAPGEQLSARGLIKLNTNENPYPPSPKVLRAVRAAVDARLRLYPDATSQPLREALARFHNCKSENIIVGNGSDELLAMAVRVFVEPGRTRGDRGLVQFFDPSYSLYPVMAALHQARTNPVPLGEDFTIPSGRELIARGWRQKAALSLVTTPNAPTGRGYGLKQLSALSRAQKGVVILDEAYADFSSAHALELGTRLPNVLVARTFSKAYSLCFQRVGYMVGPRELIEAMDKTRDSYNVNGLGQVAALATLQDHAYYQRNIERVVEERGRFGAALERCGFEVSPSQTNFLFVRPPRFPAQEWMKKLRELKILVRWFDAQRTRHFLRITIGTPKEMRRVLGVIREILK